jgi:cytochrome c-type biogenesis protein CcmH
VKRICFALATLSLAASQTAAQQRTAPSSDAPASLAVAQVLGAPRGVPLTGAALDAEVWRVGSLLRCPVCQGASIVDSPAPAAVDMRAEVRALLAAGYTENQVLAYFEHSFGSFVRLEPPARGLNLALWLAPLTALLLGAAVLVAFLHRSRRIPTDAPAPGAPDSAPAVAAPPDDSQLTDYLRRVRALTADAPNTSTQDTSKS